MFCGIATKRLLFFAAIGVVRSLSFEVERALFERVNVAHHQDRNKTEHAPEDEPVLLDRVFVNYRPGIHENDLEVEKDEEHRHEIELHAKPRMAFALRHHTAFVSGVFSSCALSACSNQNTDQQCRAGKEYCYNNLQENRQIFAQHLESLAVLTPVPLGSAYLTPARWPFCWAIAAAKAEGKPLYFLPFFLTAPRATRFCNFS